MKIALLALLLLLCTQPNFGQSSDISGFCDVLTITTNQNSEMDWDACEGMTFEGVVEIQSAEEHEYNIYTTNSVGEQLNDLSFGAYYGCLDVDSQEDLPNSDSNSPTLFFNVNESGRLSFSGMSQWWDSYSLFNVLMEGTELSFNWINTYGEGAHVQLTRQDGQNWIDLLAPCDNINQSDSLALVELYNTTDGPNWHIPWDLNSPVFTWHGVRVEPGSCRVTAVNLGPSDDLYIQGYRYVGNNLTGNIPPDLGDLNALKVLNFGVNSLTGNIPSQLGNLSSLRALNLEFNELTGAIPPSLGFIPNLNELFLSYNQLSGSVPSGFVWIRRLRLNNNKFTGEFPSLFGVPLIVVEINLSNNDFTGQIPFRFFTEFVLERFYFKNNDFSGCVGNIPKLCVKNYVPEIDTFFIGEASNTFLYGVGYNLDGNPKLAWEGDFQNACNGEDQKGAPCDDGDSNTSDDRIDANCNCTGNTVATNNIEELKSISISPNPSLPGELINVHLDLNKSINVKLKLLDGAGKIVVEKFLGEIGGSTSLTFDTETLEKGLYFLNIETSQGVDTRKLILQ